MNEQITDGDQNQLLDIKEKIYQYGQTLYSGVKKLLTSPPLSTSDSDLKKIKEYFIIKQETKTRSMIITIK